MLTELYIYLKPRRGNAGSSLLFPPHAKMEEGQREHSRNE